MALCTRAAADFGAAPVRVALELRMRFGCCPCCRSRALEVPCPLAAVACVLLPPCIAPEAVPRVLATDARSRPVTAVRAAVVVRARGALLPDAAAPAANLGLACRQEMHGAFTDKHEGVAAHQGFVGFVGKVLKCCFKSLKIGAKVLKCRWGDC
jgi:hypothetical protein